MEAGLTPLQALQGARVEASERMGREDEFETLEVGKVADLVVLEGNPLEDIRLSRSVRAVILWGEYLDATRLAELRKLPE